MDLETDPNDPEDLYIAQDADFAFADFQPTHRDTLFLLDSSPSMQTANEAGEVPFYMALQAVAGLLKSKVVADTKDAVGVIILNSGITENHMNFAGLRILRNLSPADIQGIKEMQEIAVSQNGDFPVSHKESLLVEALWLAHDMLTRAKANGTAERSLYLLTDEDNPNKASVADQRRAIQRGKDLAEQGITLEVFPFNTRGKHFDPTVFYSQLIDLEDDYTGVEKLTELQQAFRRKEFRKRTLATIPFSITPCMTIKLKVYLLAKHISRPAPVRLQAQTNKRLKTFTKFVCERTGKELWDHELGTFMEFGKEKVKMAREDLQRIKTFAKPGLQLMGFKSSKKLKDYMNLKPAYFLHPDDKSLQGSGQVLQSLLGSMAKKDKIAVARLLPRAQSVVRFVALVPSKEPQGLYAIFLPFADDMRAFESLQESQNPDLPNEKLVEAGSLMIQQLHLTELSLVHYPNPSLQHFYSTIEALALEQSTKVEVQDALLPDEEGFARKALCIQEFFFQVMEDRAVKRYAHSPSPAPVKVTKVEDKRRWRGRGKQLASLWSNVWTGRHSRANCLIVIYPKVEENGEFLRF